MRMMLTGFAAKTYVLEHTFVRKIKHGVNKGVLSLCLHSTGLQGDIKERVALAHSTQDCFQYVGVWRSIYPIYDHTFKYCHGCIMPI
ncbi:hypothetical protein V6Z11_D08G111000 [Gossypium hirsutum]